MHSSFAFLSSGPFVCVLSCSFHEWSWVSFKRDNPAVYPFDEIPNTVFGFQKLSVSSEILISVFFLSFPVV